MAMSDDEKKLLEIYADLDLDPDHPRDSILYQIATHYINACRDAKREPDEVDGQDRKSVV